MRAFAAAALLSSVLVVAAKFSLQEGEAWLRSHPDAQTDELADLKDSNPEAYGLVKALLMKRSLGLLDPKHPTSSFAATTPSPLSQEASGPKAFANFAPVVEEKVPSSASVYQDAPKHDDWLNWRPQESASSEDADVQNVLGTVAQVSSPTKSLLGRNREKGVNAAQQSTPTAATASQPAESPPAEPKSIASGGQEGSYLKGNGFGIRKTAATTQPASLDNSYLTGLDLGGEKIARPTRKKQENLLASFSWDDDAQTTKASSANQVTSSLATRRRVVAVEAVTSDVPTGSRQPQTGSKALPADPLSAWLDGKATASRPRTVLATKFGTPADPPNPYLSDLD